MNNENLIPPKKGEIRNPDGRPKGSRNRSTIVREWLDVIRKAENPFNKEKVEMTVADQLVLAQISKGLKGDTQAFNTLMDSGFGKLKETVENQVEIKRTKIQWGDKEIEI